MEYTKSKLKAIKSVWDYFVKSVKLSISPKNEPRTLDADADDKELNGVLPSDLPIKLTSKETLIVKIMTNSNEWYSASKVGELYIAHLVVNNGLVESRSNRRSYSDLTSKSLKGLVAKGLLIEDNKKYKAK
jgi:chromatin remodeling complex protein RSC6